MNIELTSYPEGSDGFNSESGYAHNLNSDQKSGLLSMQQWIVENSIEMRTLGRFSLHPILTLLRFLRANRFDIDLTIAHILATVKWRKEVNVDWLANQKPTVILGGHCRSMDSMMRQWHCGFDRCDRPVLYKEYKQLDWQQFKNPALVDAFTKYHIWEHEMCMKLCLIQSRKQDHIVEAVTIVLDLQHFSMKDLSNSGFVSFLRTITQMDQKHYPETLGSLIMMNTPATFPVVWGMLIRVWLSERR